MMPRRITPLEKAYDTQFPDSEATLFYPESAAYQAAFDALLEQALSRGTPLSREEIISTYPNEAAFLRDAVHHAAWAEIPVPQILEGLA